MREGRNPSIELDTRIAEEVFHEIDKDQHGHISLAEFVDAYFVQQLQVEERIEELEKLLVEENRKKNGIMLRI